MKTKDEHKQKVNVAYFSPGWPLSHCANGIVAYIENIVRGFFERNDLSIEPFIFSRNIQTGNSEHFVHDLNMYLGNSSFDKLKRILYYRLNLDAVIGNTVTFKTREEIKAIVNFVTDNDIELLEVEESFGVSRLISEAVDVPVVTRLHGPWFIIGELVGEGGGQAFSERVKIEGEAILSSDAISVPSHDVLEKVREYYNVPLLNAMVIPNPVALVDDRDLWNYSDTERCILFVGRFDYVKGGDLIINAFNKIAEQDHDIKLLFAGVDNGIDIDGKRFPLEKYIETFIQKQSIRDRIQVFGHCDSKTIDSLRKKAKIVVVASRYENFPMSLLESMSIGCPVVAYSVGGIPEIIKNGYNGILVETVSSEAIADAITNIFDDPNTLIQLSKNAVSHTRTHFSPSVVAGQMKEFYVDILNKFGGC